MGCQIADGGRTVVFPIEAQQLSVQGKGVLVCRDDCEFLERLSVRDGAVGVVELYIERRLQCLARPAKLG